MNKLKKFLCGASAIVMASMAPVNAGEVNWSDPFNLAGGGAAGSVGGPYISIQGAMNGSTLDGSGTNRDGAQVKDATLGKVFGSVGGNIGWSIPLGEGFLIGIDIGLQPGDGKIKVDTGSGDSDTSGEDVDVTIGDMKTITLMPMIAVSDNSALYIKAGISHTELTWGGDMVAGLNSSMRSDTLAIGSRSLIGAHGFIQTEFGVNDFDILNIHTDTSQVIGTASPEAVYGSFSIGLKY